MTSSSLRIDGRNARGIVAHNYDKGGKIIATTKTAPADAQTSGGSLTEPEWGSAMNNATKPDKIAIAGRFLELARKEFEQAARKRIYFVLLSRSHGVTNAQIGASLGVSEAAVRAIVKKHGGGDPGDILTSPVAHVADDA